MFQKYTERAIAAVKDAKVSATELGHKEICPEHLFFALSKKTSELGAKILKMNYVTPEMIKEAIIQRLKNLESDDPFQEVVFSREIKKILQQAYETASLNTATGFVKPEHIFYAILLDKSPGMIKLFADLKFDTEKVREIIKKIVEKKTPHRYKHPEGSEKPENDDKYNHILSIVKDPGSAMIFNNAVAKLTTGEYEILGTEQIMQSVLEDDSGDLREILESVGLTPEAFSEKLKNVTSRLAEYEDKQIIFTPNALSALMQASETAKELGSTSIKPEHVVLGILKSGKGIANNIVREICPDLNKLEEQIMRPLEKQMNETPLILKFAKQEARRMGRNSVGTELILIGIMLEGSGVGANVLKDLGITVKDLRKETEQMLGTADDYSEKEITFTPRAKTVLEDAWKLAKKEMKVKIYSQHLLEAICNHPDALAAKVLAVMGADSLEIKQGILNKILNK